MAASGIRRVLMVPLCSLIIPGNVVLAQGQATSTEEINRILGSNNLLPSTGGDGKRRPQVPKTQERQVMTSRPTATTQASEVTVRFVSCLRRMRDASLPMFAPSGMVAAVGQLLAKCNEQTEAWETSCRGHGNSEDECSKRSALSAIAVMKETGRLPNHE